MLIPMEDLTNGLITIANGAVVSISNAMSPITVIAVLMLVGLSWICLIELDEVDRQGSKPEVGRH